MQLALLAFPFAIVLVGVICYKTYTRDRMEPEFNEATTEGYYVYPSPAYWTAPGVSGAYGTPPHHPAPYPPPSQAPNGHGVMTPMPAEFPKQPNFESTINFPPKTADPSASSGSSKYFSEKSLIRNDSSLSLPEAMLEKNAMLPSVDSQNKSSNQDNIPPTSKNHVVLNPFLTRVDEGARLEDKPSADPIKPDFNMPESSPPRVIHEKGYDVSPIAHSDIKESKSVIQKDLNVNYMVPDSLEPSLAKTGPAEDLPLPSLDNQPHQQDIIYNQNATSEIDDDALPRYTSGDRRIFEKFQHRVSLKQDHSYIGRFREGYRPPSTVSHPVQRNDSAAQKPPSTSKFDSKKI